MLASYTLRKVICKNEMYRELLTEMNNRKKIMTYPTVRSEIRTYNITWNALHCEISDLPFQNRLSNMVVEGLVISMAFNGTIDQYPYSCQQFKLTSIKQVMKGETYLYEPLQLVRDNSSKDPRGYRQYFYKPRNVCVRVEKTW